MKCYYAKPLNCVFFNSVHLQLLVKNLQFEDGKMISASQYFCSGSKAAVELTEEEENFADQIKVVSRSY